MKLDPPSAPTKFHSDDGVDKFLWEKFPGAIACAPLLGRFYADVGCADPFSSSNTAMLREMGWNGLAVDANPAYASLWIASRCTLATGRPFVAATVSHRKVVPFTEYPNLPYLNRVPDSAGTHTLRGTSRLEDLLRWFQFAQTSAKYLEILCLDCEGHELDVIKSLGVPFHYAGLRPRCIVTEYATAGMRPGDPVREDFGVQNLLSTLDYQLVHQTESNQVLVYDPENWNSDLEEEFALAGKTVDRAA